MEVVCIDIGTQTIQIIIIYILWINKAIKKVMYYKFIWKKKTRKNMHTHTHTHMHTHTNKHTTHKKDYSLMFQCDAV